MSKPISFVLGCGLAAFIAADRVALGQSGSCGELKRRNGEFASIKSHDSRHDARPTAREHEFWTCSFVQRSASIGS